MMFRRRKLLILWLLVVIVATTTPWSNFVGHSHWDHVRWIPFYAESVSMRFFFDIVANLLLFVPFGYLYMRSRLSINGTVFLRGILMAGLLSVGVELVQVFSHTRIPSMTDICTNVIGAGVGAAIARKASKERREVLHELDCAGER